MLWREEGRITFSTENWSHSFFKNEEQENTVASVTLHALHLYSGVSRLVHILAGTLAILTVFSWLTAILLGRCRDYATTVASFHIPSNFSFISRPTFRRCVVWLLTVSVCICSFRRQCTMSWLFEDKCRPRGPSFVRAQRWFNVGSAGHFLINRPGSRHKIQKQGLAQLNLDIWFTPPYAIEFVAECENLY
jgi:hypothetical protein